MIASLHSVTAALLVGHRRHAFGDRHPARRSWAGTVLATCR